jgi:hypothetical protein
LAQLAAAVTLCVAVTVSDRTRSAETACFAAIAAVAACACSGVGGFVKRICSNSAAFGGGGDIRGA